MPNRAGNIPQKLNSNIGLKKWPEYRIYSNIIIYFVPPRRIGLVIVTVPHYIQQRALHTAKCQEKRPVVVKRDLFSVFTLQTKSKRHVQHVTFSAIYAKLCTLTSLLELNH